MKQVHLVQTTALWNQGRRPGKAECPGFEGEPGPKVFPAGAARRMNLLLLSVLNPSVGRCLGHGRRRTAKRWADGTIGPHRYRTTQPGLDGAVHVRIANADTVDDRVICANVAVGLPLAKIVPAARGFGCVRGIVAISIDIVAIQVDCGERHSGRGETWGWERAKSEPARAMSCPP